MCPVCVATAALTVTSASLAGGLGDFHSQVPQNISFQNARKYPYYKLKEKAYANEPIVAR